MLSAEIMFHLKCTKELTNKKVTIQIIYKTVA